jgi:hypothetical protein
MGDITMIQPKENESKQSLAIPDTVGFTTEERIEFIANMIVDRIIEDEAQERVLLKEIEGSRESQQLTLA